MNSKQQAFIELVTTLKLETGIKGMLDLCKGTTLFQLFYNLINEQDKSLFINDNSMIHQIDQDLTYEEIKQRNLEILVKTLQKYSGAKGIQLKMRPDIQKIAFENNISELNVLIKSVFAVLIQQRELIHVITTLSKETQHELMEIFQEIMNGEGQKEQNEDFLQKISQLQSQIQQKDQIKKKAFQTIKLLTTENEELKQQINHMKKQMVDLRKKNQSIQELESIFSKKDADISSLNGKNQQLKLLNMRIKQQHQKQIIELEKIIQSLKKSLSKYEADSQVQKMKILLDQKGKDLEDTTSILQQQRTLLKKLRQRCSILQEKSKNFDDVRLQLQLKLEQKQMQKDTLNMKLSDLEQRVRDDQQRRQSNSFIRQRKSEVLGLQLNAKFGDLDTSSIDECPNMQCQKLRQQLGIYKNKCLELIKNNEILRGNSTQRGSIIDRPSQQVSLRLSNLTAQNVKLKQKVANLSTISSPKECEQAVVKYKKRYLNLKKKTAQDQEVRNKQAEIMMSTLCQMRRIVQQSVSGPKLVQILRKLK